MSDPRHQHVIPQSALPFSPMTISRLNRGIHPDSAGFPKPKRIGQRNYYDATAFWTWFNARKDAEPERRAA